MGLEQFDIRVEGVSAPLLRRCRCAIRLEPRLPTWLGLGKAYLRSANLRLPES